MRSVRFRKAKRMETKGPNSRVWNRNPNFQVLGGLANGGETAKRTPPALEPAQAEVALQAAAPEVRHEAVAIRVLPDGAEGYDWELPLEIGMLFAESQELLEGSGPQALLGECLEDLV